MNGHQCGIILDTRGVCVWPGHLSARVRTVHLNKSTPPALALWHPEFYYGHVYLGYSFSYPISTTTTYSVRIKGSVDANLSRCCEIPARFSGHKKEKKLFLDLKTDTSLDVASNWWRIAKVRTQAIITQTTVIWHKQMWKILRYRNVVEPKCRVPKYPGTGQL